MGVFNWEDGLKLLSSINLSEAGLMPNIKFPTMGGEVFWTDLAEYNGWRVQQNSFTKHCRILDPENIRIAWGGEDKIIELFIKLKANKEEL